MISSNQKVFFTGLLLVMLLFINRAAGAPDSTCDCGPGFPCTNGICDESAGNYPGYDGGCNPVHTIDFSLTGLCKNPCSSVGGTCKYGCDATDTEYPELYCSQIGTSCCVSTEPVCSSSRTYIDCAACAGQDTTNIICSTCCNCATTGGGGGDDDRCNNDGTCDADETHYSCPDDCDFERLVAGPTPIQTIRMDNLLTGFATFISPCSNKYSSCGAITTSSVCDVCCPQNYCSGTNYFNCGSCTSLTGDCAACCQSGASGFVTKSCNSILDSGTNCDVCCTPPLNTCGNNLLEAGEQCDNSASPSFHASQDTCQEISDTYSGGSLLCTDSCLISTSSCTIPSTSACENFQTSGDCSANPSCRWCPIPANTLIEGGQYELDDYITYPYFVPGQPVGETHWCVNISAYDPFNCGACGFNEAGTHIYNTAGGGFCSATTPFCFQGSCVSRSVASALSASQAYRAFYSSLPQINEFYSPYPILYDMDFDLYKADVAAVTNYTLRADIADRLPGVCEDVAGPGAFTYGLGCCGDYKCRSYGNICDVNRICNGSTWLNATDPAFAGTVFKTARCFDTYPIVAINNEFVKCIDDNKYADYVAKLTNDIRSSCLPATNNQPMQPLGTWQYSCPYGTYMAAGVTGNASYSCDIQKISAFERNSYIVCTVSNPVAGASNAFGFVSIINTNEDIGGVAFQDLPNTGQSTYAYCPAPFSSWKRPGGLGLDIAPQPVPQAEAFIPCPGMVNISTFNLLNTAPHISLALTGVGGSGTYIGLFCAPYTDSQVDTEETGLYALDYVAGTGNIMGSVNGHQYICHTPAPTFSQNLASYRAQVGVCCGDSSLEECVPGHIGTGGKAYFTGNYTNSSSGMRIYCNSDGTWGNDLDSPEDQAACSLIANATGRYCCSEDDDMATWWKESYSDPGSAFGGCFKGIGQRNNRNLTYNGVNYNNVMVLDGQFLGCGFNDSLFQGEYNLNNPSLCVPGAGGRLSQACLQNIEDWPNPGNGTAFRTNYPLIRNQSYCSYITVNSNLYFCSYNNVWNRTTVDSFHNSVVPANLFSYFRSQYQSSGGDPDDLTPANCCLPNQCWNPLTRACEAAVADMNAGRYALSPTEIYKCVGGEWTNIAGGVAKVTPDGCDSGFCPEANQCLFSLTGDPARNNNVTPYLVPPQCIRDGQYLGDYLCRNGVWTTRTKLLAMKLASLVSDTATLTNPPDKYQLMCAPANQVLNNLQSQGLTNAFCVLNWNDQRIIGTTLNQPLVASNHADFMAYLEQSFWMSYPRNLNFPPDTVFNYASCPPLADFGQCMSIVDSRNGKSYLKLYYDNAYGMVIISNADVNGLSPSFGQEICNDPDFPNWLKWLCPVPGDIEEILSGMRSFNRLFISKYYMTLDGSMTRSVYGVGERICDPLTRSSTWSYGFNYSYLSSVDLSYLVSFVNAESATFTPVGSGGNVIIKNPQRDPWVSLTVLRNLGQQ